MEVLQYSKGRPLRSGLASGTEARHFCDTLIQRNFLIALPLRGLLPQLLASVLLQPALRFPVCSFEDFPQQLGVGVLQRAMWLSRFISAQHRLHMALGRLDKGILGQMSSVQVPRREGTGSDSKECAPLLTEAGPTPLPAQLPCSCNIMFIKAPHLEGNDGGGVMVTTVSSPYSRTPHTTAAASQWSHLIPLTHYVRIPHPAKRKNNLTVGQLSGHRGYEPTSFPSSYESRVFKHVRPSALCPS